ncbi:MAG: tRNA lysidine(34) synthetase TilS [Bacilli bacterium]|nr:tRNA lysidine(34) synthetase TilS [Bacilli bacterium]
MDKVNRFLIEELKLNKDDVIVVGCSGGPDSMLLMFTLIQLRKEIGFKIVCAHVNHNLRKESKKECIFLNNWCNLNNVTFETMTIENYGDDNFHNEARNIRYHYFESIIEKYNGNYLMTAHHGDDLIETIMMRIVRGSTLGGYAGFSQVLNMGDYSIVRPLIYLTKDQISKYNKINKIPFVIDKSNFKDKYTRNRYRKYILPFLKKEDVNVHEKFLRFSKTLESYSKYIDKVVEELCFEIYNNNSLDLNLLLNEEYIIQEKIIYKILENYYEDDLILINNRHVELIFDLIKSNKKNTYIYLPNNIKVNKNYDRLSFTFESDDVNDYEIELINFVSLPNKKNLEIVESWDTNGNEICRINTNEVCFPLRVRTRRHGDKMSLKGTNGHKKVKDIFIDKKIDIKERDMWPIVVDSKDNIVWIPGLKKSKFCKQKTEKCDIIIRYY